MGFQLSAGVTVREIDLTNIVPSVDTTGAGTVGQFTWGPVLDYTIVSDTDRLLAQFGKPTDANYVDWFTANDFLAYSSNLNLIRVVDETDALNAVAASSPILIKNVQHFELVKTGAIANEFAAKYPGDLGNSIEVHIADSNTYDTWYYKNEFDGAPGTSDWSMDKGAPNANDEIHVLILDRTGKISGVPNSILERFGFLSKARENRTLDGEPNFYGAILNKQSQFVWFVGKPDASNFVIDGELDAITVTAGGSGYVAAPVVSIGGDGAGATGTAVLSSTGTVISASVSNGGTGYSAGDLIAITGDGTGATAEVVTVNAGEILTISITNAGSGYSTVGIDASATGAGDAVGSAVLGFSVDSVTLTAPGAGYTTVTVTFDSGVAAATATYLSTGSKSWVTKTEVGDVYEILSAPLQLTFTGGNDGSLVTANELIIGWNMFKNAEVVDISLLFVGDAGGQASSGAVVRHVIDNVVEHRKDCVMFFSPDRADVFNLTEEQAVENAAAFRNVKINRPSSYAIMDSGWKSRYDVYADEYRWIPLNGDIAGLAARTDDSNDPWWSPAGYLRGVIKNIARLSYSPGKTSRDTLYKNGINPVVTFAGEGTILYGDRTQQLRSAAFSKINIRRLFIVLEKSIAKMAKYSLFEFNDEFTRSQFRNTVIPFLEMVQARRGIFEFEVVCDETNNTPEVIDRSEFKAAIYIKPAYSIGFIELDFVAVRTGVEFNEVIGKY